MVDPETILGVVLAGGRSSRMQGPDKALIALDQKPMLARCIERLVPQVGAVAVNTNRPQSDRLEAINTRKYPVFADTVRGYKGPLAGVLAAMQFALAQETKITHVATVATDSPFFPHDLVARLAEAVSDTAPIAIAASGGHRHPVFALWPVALAENLKHWLTTSETMKVMAWVKPLGHCEVEFPPVNGVDAFFNINTPEDLKQAIRLLETIT